MTPNHAHSALMGVFGMLALALMTFVLRQTSTSEDWPSVEKFVKLGFWGTNIGLAMMVIMSLFPGGVLQVLDVVENGYWQARSAAYTRSTLAQTFEWLRFPGDKYLCINYKVYYKIIINIKAQETLRYITLSEIEEKT